MTQRPLIDRFALRHRGVARAFTSLVLVAPGPVRWRVLKAAFDNATHRFNRHDVDSMLSGWADEVQYQPPPPLAGSTCLTTRVAAADFWRRTFELFPECWMEDLDVRQTGFRTVRRESRVHHVEAETGRVEDYVIAQTAEIRGGLVVRMFDELVGSRALE